MFQQRLFSAFAAVTALLAPVRDTFRINLAREELRVADVAPGRGPLRPHNPPRRSLYTYHCGARGIGRRK